MQRKIFCLQRFLLSQPYKAAMSVNFEQRATYRDRADCCHTTPSSYQIPKEMAAMTSHSIKMELQCIFTSHFGQDLSDINFRSKSTGTDDRLLGHLVPLTLQHSIFSSWISRGSCLRSTTSAYHSCCNLMPGWELPAVNCTRCLYRHDGCRAAHGDPTAYPYKCRSAELHHIAYQISLWFSILSLLHLQPHYNDMVYLSRVRPVPWLLYVIRRAGPRHVDAPGSAIIWSPLKPRFFKLFLPRRGLANLSDSECANCG
jgi:hypothetical protein